MGKRIDMSGMRFGMITVLSEWTRIKNKTFWMGRCDCGREKFFYSESLKVGHSKSCGCNSRTACAQKLMIYGKKCYTIREYRIWDSMKARCRYANRASWKDYGGRGIVVCERWDKSFNAFMEDMGPCPSDRHTIERIDNNGNYCPENCRWATYAEQSLNRSNNRVIEFNGESKTLKEWAESTGLDRTTIQARIDYYGWSVDKALTTPKIYRGVRRDRLPKTG